MKKDSLGRWSAEVRITGAGVSNWFFCKTEYTILELTPTLGGSGYVEITNDGIDTINTGNVTTSQWPLGTVLSRTMDTMISVTAFRLVSLGGVCRLTATGRGVENV